jgi:cytochrome c oxidase assembly protein subunit 15
MFQAWFGSIVVATNLVPWTITVHLFFAIVIIAIQAIILLLVSPSQQIKLHLSAPMRWIVGITFLITFIQMFLGTQVRESIDMLTMQGYGRDSWTDKLGMPFYIHRSFSWLVLILLTVLAWLNFKGPKQRLIYMAFIVLAIELTSGVLLAYADMPGLVQTSHLIFATWLLTILLLATLRMRKLAVN